MPSGDYEWLECPWIPRNFPEDTLAEESLCLVIEHTKKWLFFFFKCKKVNVPWHMQWSHITHKYCEVPYDFNDPHQVVKASINEQKSPGLTWLSLQPVATDDQRSLTIQLQSTVSHIMIPSKIKSLWSTLCWHNENNEDLKRLSPYNVWAEAVIRRNRSV